MQLSSLKKRLGDILVDVGIITPTQLKEALEIQKRNGGKLGAILSQMGALNEEVMLAFLGKQCGVSYISLAEYGDISPETIRAVPESIVRHQLLIPIAKENNTLTVAMADPFNVFAVDDIKLMTGYDVQVVIASESEIYAAIQNYYSHRSEPLAAAALPVKGKPPSAGDLVLPLIIEGLKLKAADIHLEPYSDAMRVRYRIDGILYEKSSLPKETHKTVIRQIKTMASLNLEEQEQPQDGLLRAAIDGMGLNVKVCLIPSIYGEKAVLHLTQPSVMCMDLSKLGFDPESLAVYKNKTESSHGLILLAGPIGSGKTTTLYSTLAALNYPDRNIVTIEEHVAYPIPGVTQIQTAPESGFTYATGIRAALKQNPDIVMIGDLADRETASLALTTALAGHTVFSTLTTNGTIESISHLATMGIEPFLITSTITMVVSQRLMRIICPHCKESYEISAQSLHNIGMGLAPHGEHGKVVLSRGQGCPACAFTGYSGRTAVFEMLELNEKLCTLILERAPESVLRDAALERGFFPLREAAWRKVRAGVSTIEEMFRITKFAKAP